MKKSIFLLCLLVMPCAFGMSMFDTISSLLPTRVTSTLQFQQNLAFLKKLSKTQLAKEGIKTIIKTVVALYITQFVDTFFHELGHALTAKIVWKEPIYIVIGSYNLKDKTLVGLPGFVMKGLNPLQAFCLIKTPENASYLSKIAVHAAGPLAGFCSSYIGYRNFSHPTTISEIVLNCGFYANAGRLITNFIPGANMDGCGNDGYKIAQSLNISEEILKKIVKNYVLIGCLSGGILGFFGSLLLDYYYNSYKHHKTITEMEEFFPSHGFKKNENNQTACS